jgi:hypothetical protein
MWLGHNLIGWNLERWKMQNARKRKRRRIGQRSERSERSERRSIDGFQYFIKRREGKHK